MLRKTILQGDIAKLKYQLASAPELTNQLIVQQAGKPYRVHPVHWICDVVFENKVTEEKGLEMVRILLDAGTSTEIIPGATSADTPLITASSLYCDSIAIYLIERGADLKPRGTHQATALHWASWTGAERVVERLLREEVAIDDQKDEFRSTPLLWAINGWLNPSPRNKRGQPKVIELLLAAGADPHRKDGDGRRALDILQDRQEAELIALLKEQGA
jgi:ankyrin repeat protein